MKRHRQLLAHFSSSAAIVLSGTAWLMASSPAAAAACQGPPGSPAPTQTKCVTAIAIPGNPLRSFDISWVSIDRGEYYLADRSNAGIDVIDTKTLTFKRTIGASLASFLRWGRSTTIYPDLTALRLITAGSMRVRSRRQVLRLAKRLLENHWLISMSFGSCGRGKAG
jgi:hypothetical protein